MLEPRSQEIPFRFGLDLTEDEEGSPNGALELTNFDFDREGALIRRPGFALLSQSSAGPLTNSTGDYLGFVQAGDRLGFVRSGSVDPFVPGASPGTSLGTRHTHESLSTYWNGKRTQSVDAAIANNAGGPYLCLVTTHLTEAVGTEITDPSPVYEVVVKVVSLTTGAILMEESCGTGTYGGRVVVLQAAGQTRFCVFYIVTSTKNLTFRYAPANTAPTLSSATTIVQTNITLYGPASLAVTANAAATLAYVATFDNTSHNNIRAIDGTGTVTATSFTGTTSEHHLAITMLASGSVALVEDNNFDTLVSTYPAGLGTSTTSQTLSHSNVLVRTVAAVEILSGVIGVLVDIGSEGLLTSTCTVGATFLLGGTFPNTSLVGQPWVYTLTGGGKEMLFPAAATNNAVTDYRTVLVLANKGTVLQPVGQVTFDEAGPAAGVLFRSNMLTQVPVDSSGRYILPLLVDIESGDAVSTGADKRVRRVRVVRLDFGLDTVASTTSLGDVGFVAGSLPVSFDGTTAGSVSFPDAPSAPTLTSPNAGVLTGTYSYCVVLEYNDANGNLQVSPPSLVAAATVTTKKITVAGTVAPHLVGRTTTDTRLVRIKIYRTEASGSVFHLAHTYVLSAGSTYTVDDNVPDATLTSAETLYTTGGALESEPVPPLLHVCAHRNRLFGIRSDTPTVISYTQEFAAPSLPRWHAVLTFAVDNAGGKCTAVASLGDKLIVFQESRICYVVGEGPDGLGNGAFSLPETLPGGIGVAAEDRGSVVNTPEGVMFRHSSGIYLLTNSLELVPVGRAIRPDYNSDDHVIRGRYLPSRSQVVFLFRSAAGAARNSMYVHDLRFHRWVRWDVTLAAFEDIIEHAGTVYALTRTQLWGLDPSRDADFNGSNTLFPQVVGLPWFRGDRAQEQRLWKVHVAARKSAGFTNNINVALEVFTQDERRLKTSSTADATYTWAGTDTAGLANNFLLSARAVTQRCRAFRCRLTVTPQASESGSPGLVLGALVYDFGALPGRGKQPSRGRPTAS